MARDGDCDRPTMRNGFHDENIYLYPALVMIEPAKLVVATTEFFVAFFPD